MSKKVLIIGLGQDGTILKEICTANSINHYVISKLKVFKKDKKIFNIDFNGEAMGNFINENLFDIVFYTSALQIGNSIKDNSREKDFFNINSTVPYDILKVVSECQPKKSIKFYYFSSCYLFSPNEAINLESSMVLNDPYKKSKFDFLKKVKSYEFNKNISIQNIYLFPHDSPLKNSSFLKKIIQTVKEGKKMNIISNKNNQDIFIDCAYELMFSIYTDAIKNNFNTGVDEKFLGGHNYFSLNDLINFLIKKYQNGSEVNSFFNISNSEIDRYYLSTNLYKSSLQYEKIPGKVLWERMLLDKKSYIHAIQNNLFKT